MPGRTIEDGPLAGVGRENRNKAPDVHEFAITDAEKRGVVAFTPLTPMPALFSAVVFRTTLLLICSNVFMTFAWYAHLRNLSGRPWYVAAIVSWGIALFEYLLQVPANRIGYTQHSLAQLKILQEVITLGVFVPFAVFYMRQPLKWDYLWAALCIVGAVYFMFRGGIGAGH